MPAIKRTNRLNKRQLIDEANRMFAPHVAEPEPSYGSLFMARSALLPGTCQCGQAASDVKIIAGTWRPVCEQCLRDFRR